MKSFFLLCAILSQVLIAAEKSGDFSQILGRPTDRSIALNVLSVCDLECSIEYAAQSATQQTPWMIAKAGVPTVLEIGGLMANTKYTYRLCSRRPGEGTSNPGPTYSFQTQRALGSTFSFSVQGDSHPEREGKMFNADLYRQTMMNIFQDHPDFHITLGDDFSIERLIERKNLSQANVDQVYAQQRCFLGIVGTSAALFLVNGNHEQAARPWLDGTQENPAVLAGKARNSFFALPVPDAFYSGDTENVPHIGLLRDFYAWTWGDALFVTIDPYWHSPVEVDHDRNSEKGGKGRK